MKCLAMTIVAALSLTGCETPHRENPPVDARVAMQRGVLSTEHGDFRAAIVEYEKVLRLQPKNAEVVYLRGVAYERLGDRNSAISNYDTAVTLNPNLLPAYVARAALHEASGDFAAAAADYAIVRRLSGDDQQR